MNGWKKYLFDRVGNARLAWVVLLACLICAAGLSRLTLESDYKIFFDEGNPELATFESFQQVFSTSDNVFLVVEPKQGDVYNKQTLSLVHQLTEAAWQFPYAIRVNSIVNYPDTRAEGDDIFIEEFVVDPEQLSEEKIAYLKQEVMNEPELADQLINASGRQTALNIIIKLPGENGKKEIGEVAAAVRQTVAHFEQIYLDHKIYTSGVVMMNNAFFEAARGDFITLIPLMIVVILFTAGVLLKSRAGVLAVTGVVIFSVLSALGLAGWLSIPLSAPAVSAPIILLTIIIASTVHVLTSLQKAVNQGMDNHQAVNWALSKNFVPIMLTNGTTLIGFLTMNFSESPPFRDLGNIVAIGVAASFFLTISFLPMLMRKYPMQPQKATSHWLSNKLADLSEWIYQRRRLLLCTALPAAVLLSLFSLTNVLNDDFIKYFDESVEFRRDTDHINRSLTGIYTIEYAIDSREDNGIFRTDLLQFAESFAAWLRNQPEVVSVTSLTDTLKDINRNMYGGSDDAYRLPDSREKAGQYFLLYEMSLPFGMDLNDRINVSKSSLRTTVRLNNMSTIELLALEQRANQWLEQRLVGSDIAVDYSSPTVMFSHIGDRNIKSLLKGSLIALLAISLVLAFAFRSLRIGLVSIIPNVFPAAIAFGIWGLTHGEISLGLAGVSAMTLGIVVDDTVHFIYRYLVSLKNNDSPQAACREAFSSVGTAMVISSVLLTIGFFILSLSSFEKNASMGLLTGITIVIALVFDLLLLPAILSKTVPHSSKAGEKSNSLELAYDAQ